MTAPEIAHTEPNASAAPNAPKQPLKQRVYVALEDPAKASPLGKFLGIGLIVLIVLNALLVGVPDNNTTLDFNTLILGFSVLSVIAFAAEYACRIWIADLVYPTLAPTRARVRYIFSLMGIIDFLAWFPALFVFFLPASNALNDAIRIIRLVRLIKILALYARPADHQPRVREATPRDRGGVHGAHAFGGSFERAHV